MLLRLNVLALSAVFLLLTGQLNAQESGQIAGTVKDQSGAVIPNVTVTASEAGTNLSRTAVSNSSGQYELRSLRPTTYTVSAEISGFKKVTESDVRLEANQSLTLNLALELGQVSESVTIESNAVQVDTSTSTIREVVDQSRIVDLPLNGRNAANLTTLLPGVSTVLGGGADQGITKTFPGQPNVYSNGAGSGTTSFQLDGNNNNDHYTQINQPFPAPDFLQEFSVQTSNYDAQYGSNAGAVVNAVTRSGTNEIHGSLFEFVRNGYFNARNYFAASPDPLKRNQYGASFGGPVVFPKLYNGRNRTFIFVGWQQSAIRSTANATNAFVPTPDELKGNFASCGASCAKALKDPLSAGGTGTFAGNQVPISLLDPVSLNVSKLLPAATDATGLTFFGKNTKQDFNEGVAKFDHQINDKDRMSVRYFIDHFILAENLQPGNLLTYADSARIRSQNATISETHIFSPTILNEARIGWVRVISSRAPPSNSPDLHDFGMTINQQPQPKGLLGITVTGGWSRIGDELTAKFPRDNWTFSDRLLWVKGNHSISLGFSIDKERADIVNQYRTGAAFTFSGQVTGYGIADFMLGRIGSMDQGMGEYKNNRDTFYAPFVQDNWKVSKRLTVNLGLRYEPYSPWRETVGRWERFFPQDYYAGFKSAQFVNSPTGETYRGDPGVPYDGTIGDYNNLAPRIGFAYDLTGDGKMSIRGGGGFFYDQRGSGIINNGGVDASPWSARTSYTLQCEQGPALPRAACFQAPYVGAAKVDVFPQLLGDKNAAFPTPVTLTTYSQKATTTLAYNWNLTLERQIGEYVVRVAYVASRTTHGGGGPQMNPAIPTPGATTATTDARRVFQPYGPISQMGSDGLASYHSLQASANKRFSHGFTVQSNYTWSKAMDYTRIILWTLPDGRNYGPSNTDHTHRFVLSYVWHAPDIVKNRAAGTLLNGWQLTGASVLQSGAPGTIASGLDNSRTGLGNDRAIYTGVNPVAPDGVDPTLEWFNPAAYAVNPVGTYGTLGKGTLRQPGSFNWDMGLFKNIKISERFGVQFRSEFFNVFNHTNLGVAGVTVNTASSFGRITSAGDPRIMQFGLKLNY
jgi:hypothetical protein